MAELRNIVKKVSLKPKDKPIIAISFISPPPNPFRFVIRRKIKAIRMKIPAPKAKPLRAFQNPRSLKNEKIIAITIIGNVMISGMIR